VLNHDFLGSTLTRDGGMKMTRWILGAWALTLAVAGCDETTSSPPIDTPTPVPCEQGNVAGVPVVALEWSSLRETYLAPDHGAAHLGVDYLVSPRAHVDQVELRFDFDPLVTTESVTFDGECQLMFPLEPLLSAVPPETEDVVAARVIASSNSGTSRTGRIFATTGTHAIELRTDGLDAGDPADGDWWAIFEPAAGRARLIIVPAALDRTTFRLTGVPINQPGVVALIQTQALEFDAATRTVYAPWGFAGDWRRYARAWHQTVLWQQPEGLVDLGVIVLRISLKVNADLAPSWTPVSRHRDHGSVSLGVWVVVVSLKVLDDGGLAPVRRGRRRIRAPAAVAPPQSPAFPVIPPAVSSSRGSFGEMGPSVRPGVHCG